MRQRGGVSTDRPPHQSSILHNSTVSTTYRPLQVVNIKVAYVIVLTSGISIVGIGIFRIIGGILNDLRIVSESLHQVIMMSRADGMSSM